MRDSLSSLIDSMVLNGLFDETVSGNAVYPLYIKYGDLLRQARQLPVHSYRKAIGVPVHFPNVV